MSQASTEFLPHHARDWEHVEELIARIDPEFFNKLSSRFPEITWIEMRICAMARLDLSVKEMAAVLKLSTVTVMNQRSKTRKRLNLPRNKSLTLSIHSIDNG